MREQKKHWHGRRFTFDRGFINCGTLCGYRSTIAKFANAKKNVTCKNCLRSMGKAK